MISRLAGPTAAGDAEPALFNRERELARVDAALATASGGTGAVLLVEGAAGIGKTRLLRVARDRAQAAGLTAIHGRGSELEQEYAFGVVRQCLGPVVRATYGSERTRVMAGAAGLARSVVLDAREGVSSSYAMLHGLYWLVSNLADDLPLLLVVDDAQWADEPSLRFLRFLVHRIEPLPVVVIVAVRTENGGTPEPPELADLRGAPVTELLTPAALDAAAVGALLVELGGETPDPAFAVACRQATGGNPFLVVELARTLREQQIPATAEAARHLSALAPREVTRRVQSRLLGLDQSARALAGAIAILGDDVTLDLATELAGLDPGAGADAAHVLEAAQLVEPGRLVRFRHPLLGAAVSAAQTPGDRDAAHRRAVDVLRRRGAPSERIALHILASTPGHRQADVATLRDAARRARESGAPAAAVPLLRRGLEEALEPRERGTVLLELGSTELIAGAQENACEHLGAAALCATSPVERARAIAALTHVSHVDPVFWRDLGQSLDVALDELDAVDRELVLELQTARLLVATLVGDQADPKVLAIATRFARLMGNTPAECAALGQLAEHRRLGGANAAELGDLAERATRTVDALLQSGSDTPTMFYIFENLRNADRLDAGERLAKLGIEIARKLGAARSFAAAQGHHAAMQHRRGRLCSAEADARTACAIPPSDPVWRAYPRGQLTRCLLDRGHVAAAKEAYDASGVGEDVPDFGPFTSLLFVRMLLRAAEGRHRDALADFDEARRRIGSRNALGPLVGEHLVAVESHRALGEDLIAAELLEQTLAIARDWGTVAAIGQALRVQGQLADGNDAITLLHDAVDLLEQSPARLEHARALIALGARLRHAGQRHDARQQLRVGHELARACGADALTETARVELAASGGRARRSRDTGVASLTTSERRIADMAAAGASNAQIAQSLFVTIKTVEMHLTNVYRKLGITTRHKLARLLEAGLD